MEKYVISTWSFWNDTDTVIRRGIRALRLIMAENRHASTRTDRHAPAHIGRMNGLQRGSTLKLATWNCGGLSFTQRELCAQLGYGVLGLTETHDKGSLPPHKHCLTGDAAPARDPYSGVTMLLSDRVADSVMYNGCLGWRIVYARIRASPCNLFVVCVYVPHAGTPHLLTRGPWNTSNQCANAWLHDCPRRLQCEAGP